MSARIDVMLSFQDKILRLISQLQSRLYYMATVLEALRRDPDNISLREEMRRYASEIEAVKTQLDV